MTWMDALAGRACGDCTVCCTVKPIVTPGLVKAPGDTCGHCTGTGCAIYETRFEVCSGYLCGYRLFSWVPEDLRPDRSGVLIEPHTGAAPEGFEGQVHILAFRDPVVLGLEPLRGLIAALIRERIAVYLSLPGPPGMFDAKTLVNHGLAKAVADHDLPLFLAEMRAVVQALRNHPFEPFEAPAAG